MNRTKLTTVDPIGRALFAGGAGVLAASLLLLTPTAGAEGKLFFTDLFNPTFSDGFLRSCNTDGTGMHTLASGLSGLRGVAVDPGQEKVYWTDVDNDVIRRANLDGTGVEDLVTVDLVFPMSIDVYDGGGRFFWGDQSATHIRFANLDGWNDSLLGLTPFHAGIAIDEVNRKLYWSLSIDAGHGSIYRTNLDGTGTEVVTSVGKPADIALDVAGGKIYWTDYVIDVVRRANLNGTNVQDLYEVGANLNPGGIALDLADGKVYWGQSVSSNRMNIMRMNLNGSAPPEVVVTGLGNIGEMVFVPITCPGDVDGDGVLGFSDLLHVLSFWGPCP